MTRGQLRIYLGAAPGVGKTFAMLDEGWRRAQRGTDVVVGYVETHNRPKTAAQLRDLEVVPRHRLTYRGQSFEEMDLDALLERRPKVALVDELAHTNVPGSRNTKRWQDIEELLAAGIDVISTVNIQHLESLNDVVEGITDVKQQETVPDSFVRDAEQVELVDMTPEALRRRMVHGNIYAPEKVDAALGNYFRVGNLNALRELGLLWMADKVDEALLDYRDRHGIAGQWETKERVIVALTGAPGGDNLIRRAARTASRLRGELLGVHVKSGDGLTTSGGPGLENQRLLLHELGGRYVEVVGDDVGKALVHVARSENATQVLLGATRRSRWSELVRGSVINTVIRHSGDAIDVHVISKTSREVTEKPALRPQPRRFIAHLPRRRQIVAYGFAAVGLPLLTLVLSHFRADVGLQNALLCYLLLVVGVATVGGALPAAGCVGERVLLLNWFFVPPIHTFTIGNGRDVLALVSFLVVAGVISTLVEIAARRQSDAYRAQGEAEALALMSGTLLQDPEPLPKLTEQLTTALALDGASVLNRAGAYAPWYVEASSGPDPPADPEAAMLVVALGDDRVLALRGRYLRAEHRQLIGPFATQLTLAIQARRLQAEAATAASLAKANELRTALLAAVSHDLRTPLASIRASATALLSEEIKWEPSATRELLRTIDDEADRLNTLVGNLLDMSRLQTGTFTIHSRLVGLDEVVGAALVSLHLPPLRVEFDVPETLPQVNVDAGLLERAIANLLDNALRFSPPGRPVRVEATLVGNVVELRVIDHGPGIPLADRDRVFQAFQRLGDQPNGTGVGLGLAVAKGLAEATGGSVEIEDTAGGGCTMVVKLAGRAMTSLLLIDDEVPFVRALSISLRGSGYDVQAAASGAEGLKMASRSVLDVVVLDLGLPDIDGIDVLRALRAWTAVPVIVLSARQDDASIVAALDAGADDYVTKPFSMGQLLARIRAALRRVMPNADQPIIVTDHFRVDLVTHEVTGSDGHIVKLTPTEWGVLEVLVRNRGKLVTQRQLLQEVWGPQYGKETEYLRVYMGALRRKLEPTPSQPRYFITEPGMGYRFVSDAA